MGASMPKRSEDQSTKKRLALAVCRILLALLVLGIFSFLLAREGVKLHEYEQILKQTDLSSSVLKLIFETARERGLTSIFLASNGTKGEAKVKEQRVATDGHLQAFRNLAARTTLPNKKALQTALAALDTIPSLRYQVDNRAITPAQSLDNYTDINSLMMDVVSALTTTDNAAFTSTLLARLYAAQMIEWQGVRRGTLSAIFQFGYWPNDEYYSRTVSIETRIKVFTQDFYYYASPAQIKNLHDNYNASRVASAIENVTKFVNRATSMRNATLQEPFGVDPVLWFDNASLQISATTATYERISLDLSAIVASTRALDLAAMIIGFVVEFIAATQLIWLAGPILVFYIRSQLAMKRDLNSGSSSKVDSNVATKHTSTAKTMEV